MQYPFPHEYQQLQSCVLVRAAQSFYHRHEFLKFIDAVKDKPESYAIFMTLYYTGIREGELLALTPADVDLEKQTIRISKSYQRID